MVEPLSVEAVSWGYRLFLDREPESQIAVDRALTYGSVAAFREALLNCDEFSNRNRHGRARLSLDAPAIEVECDTDPVSAEILLSHVRDTWTRLGQERPHWSVLSAEQFLPEHAAGSETAFFGSGAKDAADLLAILTRNGFALDRLRHAFEFGCGLARVTPYLARAFERVTSCDISATHLEMARQVLAKSGAANVHLLLADTTSFGMDGLFDVWFSRIVLQHNPPPIMAWILRRAFSRLAPGGVAVFQVPTYCRQYRFKTQEYLAARPALGEIEMHVLPQWAVFQIALETGCRPLEVREDGAIGLGSAWVSNTFVVGRADIGR